MQYENGFELLIAVVYSMSPQLGGIGHKAQELGIPFQISEGQPLPYFHLVSLSIRSKLVLKRYQTGQINDPTGK